MYVLYEQNSQKPVKNRSGWYFNSKSTGRKLYDLILIIALHCIALQKKKKKTSVGTFVLVDL